MYSSPSMWSASNTIRRGIHWQPCGQVFKGTFCSKRLIGYMYIKLDIELSQTVIYLCFNFLHRRIIWTKSVQLQFPKSWMCVLRWLILQRLSRPSSNHCSSPSQIVTTSNNNIMVMPLLPICIIHLKEYSALEFIGTRKRNTKFLKELSRLKLHERTGS